MKNGVILIFIGVVLLISGVAVYFSVAPNESVSTVTPVNQASSFTPEPIFTFEPFSNIADLVAYSDSRSVFISKDDGTDEWVIYSSKATSNTLYGFIWSPNGRALIFYESKEGDGERILLANLIQGKVYVVRPYGRYGNVAWAPTSGAIAFVESKEINKKNGIYSRSLHVVDITLTNTAMILSEKVSPSVTAVSQRVAWVSDSIYFVANNRKLVQFNTQQQKIFPVVERTITAFAISSISQKLVYALPTGEVYLRDLSQSNPSDLLVGDLSPEIDYAEELAFSPNGKYVAGYTVPNRNFYYNVNDNDKSIKYFPGDLSWSTSPSGDVEEYLGKVILRGPDGKLFLFDISNNVIENVDESIKVKLFSVYN